MDPAVKPVQEPTLQNSPDTDPHWARERSSFSELKPRSLSRQLGPQLSSPQPGQLLLFYPVSPSLGGSSQSLTFLGGVFSQSDLPGAAVFSQPA